VAHPAAIALEKPMIVPATRKYLAPERVATIKEGETFSIDSNLGGAFTVEYMGRRGNLTVWRNVSKGWESYTYEIPLADVPKRIFILIPAETYLRELADQLSPEQYKLYGVTESTVREADCVYQLHGLKLDLGFRAVDGKARLHWRLRRPAVHSRTNPREEQVMWGRSSRDPEALKEFTDNPPAVLEAWRAQFPEVP
jgi:hypothetical protein